TAKIGDFGLARWLEDERGLTASGEVAGTASYMAPEQAQGQRQCIGPPSDVYALGAILYELLVGRPPFRGTTTAETLVQVLTSEAVPPRRLQPAVPRDLETVCLKCLDKEPRRRYASARALSDDLQRYLDGRPIQARSSSAAERLLKAARRHPTVAALLFVTLVITVVGVSLVTWKWREAEALARSESAAHRDTERMLAAVTLDKGVNLCETGEVAQGLLWLARALEIAEGAGDAELAHIARANLSSWRDLLVAPRADLRHSHWVWDVAFSPDGRLALTGSRDGTARLWDALTGKPATSSSGVLPVLKHDLPVWAIAFSPDGKTILTGTGSEDGTKGKICLWHTATAQPRGLPIDVEGMVQSVSLERSGRRFLVLAGGQASLWNLPANSDRAELAGKLPHDSAVRAAQFRPDGAQVATAGADGKVRLWNTDTRAEVGGPLEHDGPVQLLDFSPDGQTLATACAVKSPKSYRGVEAQAWLWDLKSNKPRGKLDGQPGPLKDLRFSPDGSLLVCAGLAPPDMGQSELRGTARVWDVASMQAATPALIHQGPVWCAVFSPDGRFLLTGSEDRKARLWLTGTGAPFGRIIDQGDLVRSVAFSPDGRRALLASAGEQARARLIEVPQARLVRSLRQAQPTFRLFASDKILLVGGKTKSQLWSLSALKPQGQPLEHQYYITSAVFLRGGSRLRTSCGGGIQTWDTATGKPSAALVPLDIGQENALLSSDGTRLLCGGRNVSRLFDMPTGVWRPVKYVSVENALSMAFLPDGQHFFTGGRHLVRWQIDEGKPVNVTPAPEDVVENMTLSPDGSRLVTWGKTYRAQQWDAASGRPLGAFFPSRAWLTDVAIGADNRSTLVCDRSGQARLWDLPTGNPLGPPLPHGNGLSAGLVLPLETPVLVGAGNWVHCWEVPAPWPGSAARVRQEIEFLTGMSLDESGTVRFLSP
ncbi:MAG: protein kinase, partial [Gemmataceae bacterium]